MKGAITRQVDLYQPCIMATKKGSLICYRCKSVLIDDINQGKRVIASTLPTKDGEIYIKLSVWCECCDNQLYKIIFLDDFLDIYEPSK